MGHGLLTWSLRHTTPTVVALAILGEPVGSTLLAWAWLGEAAPAVVLVGCGVVLAALVLALSRPRPGAGDGGGGAVIDRYLADHLLPMGPAFSLHSPGFVDVAGGWVVASGPLAEAPALGPDDAVHRLEGLLLPGLVNCHAHSAMTVLRGAGEGLPLDRWLREVIWPREARLTPEDARVGMLVGAAEMLLGGHHHQRRDVLPRRRRGRGGARRPACAPWCSRPSWRPPAGSASARRPT